MESTKLDLDRRFFVKDLCAGDAVLIKGDANTGKTYLLTYLVSNYLRFYNDKKVIFIDTSHQFSMRNLIKILAHGMDFKDKVLDESLSVEEIVKTTPKLSDQLNRLLIIHCFTPEEFLASIVFLDSTNSSSVKSLLAQDPSIGLIAIDCIDNYSFVERLDKDKVVNIMNGIRGNIGFCPLICTSLDVKYESNFMDLNWYRNLYVDPDYFTHTLRLVPDPITKKATEYSNYQDAGFYKARLTTKNKSVTNEVTFCIYSNMLWVCQ